MTPLNLIVGLIVAVLVVFYARAKDDDWRNRRGK